MNNNNRTDLNRRKFLKVTGAGAVAATAAAMYGCGADSTTEAGITSGDVPTDKMTYRTNPHTGDKVSLLGYGCMRWPLRVNSSGRQEVDQETVNELVSYAIDHGVNYFDTAPRYVQGWSETATGIALSRHQRDKYFIATKLSNSEAADMTFANSMAMYERSFKSLQVDYIDYYLLHNIGNGGMETFNRRFINNGVLTHLLKEREAGRIRNLGFSFHGDASVFQKVLELDVRWDFAQIQLNYIDWQNADTSRNPNAEYLYSELEKKNIAVAVMEPLLGGRLARVPARALSLMQDASPGDTPAQWAFRYAASLDKVLTVLSGMTYMEHLRENILTYSPFKPLSDVEEEALNQVTRIMTGTDFIQCTTCQYCMPCPYGLDIPGIFDHYNRCLNAGRILARSTGENYRRARREFLIGYDRSVPKLRQASHCTGCRLCEPKCTQSLSIADEMRRIDIYAELLKQGKEF